MDDEGRYEDNPRLAATRFTIARTLNLSRKDGASFVGSW
jgi:hypothetical protein